MSVTQAQLDDAIAALGVAITNQDSLIARILAAVIILVDKVNAGGPGINLTQELFTINAIVDDMGSQATKIQAALIASAPASDVVPKPPTNPVINP